MRQDPIDPGAPRRTRVIVGAGLAQLALLAGAFLAASPGVSSNSEFLPAAALLGLALLPIGFSLRLRWLAPVSLAWGALLLVLIVHTSRGGVDSGAASALVNLALLLAGAAAATGQWSNLDRLPLGRFGSGLRWLTRLSIAASVLFLVGYVGRISGVVGALALLLGTVVDLALTGLTLLTGAVHALRHPPRTKSA